MRGAEGDRWVETIDLKPGDALIEGASGQVLTVQSATLKDGLAQTYNLEVADFHTFLIGEDGVVVHNCLRFGAQLGKKFGQKLRELGLTDYRTYKSVAERVFARPTEKRIGTFSGQTDIVFSQKGDWLLLTKPDGQFVSMFRGGSSNSYFQSARPYP